MLRGAQLPQTAASLPPAVAPAQRAPLASRLLCCQKGGGDGYMYIHPVPIVRFQQPWPRPPTPAPLGPWSSTLPHDCALCCASCILYTFLSSCNLAYQCDKAAAGSAGLGPQESNDHPPRRRQRCCPRAGRAGPEQKQRQSPSIYESVAAAAAAFQPPKSSAELASKSLVGGCW